jgi:hypothetical protein
MGEIEEGKKWIIITTSILIKHVVLDKVSVKHWGYKP